MSESNKCNLHADWYEHAFGALYPIIYRHRTVEAAEPEARFAAERLELNASDTLLDLCCGNARHLVHLTARCKHCVGLDYSKELLAIADETAGDSVPFVRADMRAIPFSNCFDVVVNFFTSFGYFQDAHENAQVAHELARALKPGGRFFIDYLNPDYTEQTLVPESTREEGDYLIQEHRWIDRETQRVNKRTRVTHHGAILPELHESVRLYTLEELRQMLHNAGLQVDDVYGDYSGVPYEAARPRMLLVGRKN